MKELLCHFALPLTCGMAVIKDSDVLGKSLLCFSATICKMRVTFTSQWNVTKNSNRTVIRVSNVLWHILLRWEKACYCQAFTPDTQSSLHRAGWLLPQPLTDGIVSQQDQFVLQSQPPDVEAVAGLCCALHPHQDVPEVKKEGSASVHGTQPRPAACLRGTAKWTSISNLSHKVIHFNFTDVLDGTFKINAKINVTNKKSLLPTINSSIKLE